MGSRSQGRQFLLLLWKNFLIQKRKVFTTIFEIGLPTFFALILIFIRMRVQGEMKQQELWPDCRDWNEISYPLPGKIAYSPYNNATRRLMENIQLKVGFGVKTGVTGLNSENELVDFLMFANSTTNNTRDYLGGVVFTSPFYNHGDTFSQEVLYKIRLKSSPRSKQKTSANPFSGKDTNWDTQYMFPVFQRVGPREINDTCGGKPGYKREGFLAIQHAVNMAFMKEFGGDNKTDLIDTFDINLRRHPYPAFNDDNFILVIQFQFPLIIMLSFVLVALNIVKDVVHEKERKLKESMKMMGLNNWLHWAAWFVKYFLFTLITVVIMVLFFCVNTPKGPVIGQTSPTVLLVFLMLYAVSTISFCFAISVFFSKANSGAAAGGILFFLKYVPYFFIQPRYQTLTWGQKILSCLLSNVAMAYGGQVIGMFEGTGAGVQWSNVRDGVSVDDDFSMADVMIMLAIDTVIYAIITWYVEAIFPGEYGVAQKWYFPFTSSYWCGTRPDEYVTEDMRVSIGQNPEYFQADPVGEKAGIKIRNLRKEFNAKFGKKVAVSGMTLNVYEGQITALLGHNGAGKTTTMSMLTGFLPPTSGTAYVNGYDIREDINSVRDSLGLCPQHDVLFDTLTVEEHLIFFAKLKGCARSEVQEAVDEMLTSLNLRSKRHEQSRTLSGGMKRKLSVGIALIADSKIVILDEPTSGMDPDARRHIWSVLQKCRAGRTMVLTTHFMDEADLLGDRIAIMADGVVKCCGSSLFLKNKYGAGYHMVIVKEPVCDITRITELIQSYVPVAKLENNVGAELSYILPHEMSHTFEALFTQLEDHKGELGIASYGASVTTMEEVFLRVGEESMGMKESRSRTLSGQGQGSSKFVDSQGSINADLASSPITTNENTPLLSPTSNTKPSNYSNNPGYERSVSFTHNIVKNTGLRLGLQQFYAMFLKRALHSLRNIIVTITQLGIPLFFTIFALIVIKTYPGPHDSQAISLNISALGENIGVYSVDPNASISYEFGNYLNNNSDAFTFSQYYAKMFDDLPDSAQVKFVNNQTGFMEDPDIVKFLLKEGHDDIGGYNSKYMLGAEIHPMKTGEKKKLNITAYFNNQAYHSVAISLSTLSNAMLRYVTNNSDLHLEVINHPLPRTAQDKVRDQLTRSTQGFTIAFFVVFGMAFLASSFTLFLIKERSTKSKHLQFTSGVTMFTYWSATFCWDIINYLLPVVFILVALVGFDIKAFVVDDHIAHVALLFVLYGFAMLPFMYLWSFVFTIPATGYVWLTMFNILSGEATILAVNILAIPQLDLLTLAKALEWIFLVTLPNYCLGQGLQDYYTNYMYQPIYQKYCIDDQFKKLCSIVPNPCCRDITNECGEYGCIDYNSNPLAWESNGIGRMLMFLGVQFVVYSTILFLLESEVAHQFLQCLTRKSEVLVVDENILSGNMSLVQEDEDVAKERTRLASLGPQNMFSTDNLIISELNKFYGKNHAVNHISVGIPQGECFGLLGINGAGKTTTFKMLTGDETVSSGTAYLNGHSIVNQISEVRQNLGYCPQFDALIDQMTGRETMYMFARLRGIHQKQIPRVTNDLLEALLLTEHADKLTQEYSGGNKRKLSTAIALVGNPQVIFLDEPTTGMDPMARRFLWDTLCQIRASGRTLVLTSHSMEECEALCTRLAVMVNGQFKCLGSPQHLKYKFGEGYTLLARVGSIVEGAVPDALPLRQYIEKTFPGCILKDVHQGNVNYHITNTDLKWAQIFGTMERAKKEFNIEDYSVSQTTLEQVFINFARAQIPPHEPEDGCCKGCCFPCRLCVGCCMGGSKNRTDSESSAIMGSQPTNSINTIGV